MGHICEHLHQQSDLCPSFAGQQSPRFAALLESSSHVLHRCSIALCQSGRLPRCLRFSGFQWGFPANPLKVKLLRDQFGLPSNGKAPLGFVVNFRVGFDGLGACDRFAETKGLLDSFLVE